MEIQALKIVVLSTLFVSCFGACLVPLGFAICARNRQRGHERLVPAIQRLVCLFNSFGGGVFLATCLLDLLPDVQEEFEDVRHFLDIHSNFPFAEFITAVGFFLVLVLEQAVLNFQEKSAIDAKVTDESGPPQEDGRAEKYASLDDTEETSLLAYQNSRSDAGNSSSSVTSRNEVVTEIPRSETGVAEVMDGARSRPGLDKTVLIRSVLLLLALSFHSIFEGLAIGLQTSVSHLLGIFAAVAIHKTILSLSLGNALVQENRSKTFVFLSSFGFAAMAPLGIVFGILLFNEEEGLVKSAISGVLQGIATGTFLYITFFEVLGKEMGAPGDRMLKVLCAILGFGIITGTMFFKE
ncbi:zinc transporter ZIP3-like [Acanthaster planci]|uniref:Zinc transporter ZIP3-like n=1 Tax=Acanthaster planci TaxID=133434 RepID=A0A8B7ZLQ3_ACAPL|nr:zinc transporter ZIP3-like [Acanthaster planci]XP_022105827.1 zinc transporter ZIP3-like [Acanthaster planci]